MLACSEIALNAGTATQWPAARMTELWVAITEQIILHYGQSDFHPRSFRSG